MLFGAFFFIGIFCRANFVQGNNPDEQLQRPANCPKNTKLTEPHGVFLTDAAKNIICAGLILSDHQFLSLKSCFPSEDEVTKYSIFHKSYYPIKEVTFGSKVKPELTDSTHDIAFIVTDKIQFNDKTEVPFFSQLHDNISRFKTGQLIKHFSPDTKAVGGNVLNDKVTILEEEACKKLNGLTIPFSMTSNHFCLQGKCGICSEIPGSFVFNAIDEVIGMVVHQTNCDDGGAVIAIFFPEIVHSWGIELKPQGE